MRNIRPAGFAIGFLGMPIGAIALSRSNETVPRGASAASSQIDRPADTAPPAAIESSPRSEAASPGTSAPPMAVPAAKVPGPSDLSVADRALAAKLRAFLAAKKSPLAAHAEEIVLVGRRYDVDPRLLVAIAGAESQYGKIVKFKYNAWNWFSPQGKHLSSWSEGINAVAGGMHRAYIGAGRTSVSAIGAKYCPVAGTFAPGARLTVKNKIAGSDQRNVMSTVLATGRKLGASETVLLAALVCVTQESTARNLTGGDRDSVGAFQQRASMGWPASRDVARDAREFYKRAMKVHKAHPSWSPGYLADAVQRSYTYGTSRMGSDYRRWLPEARATLKAYDQTSRVNATWRGNVSKLYAALGGDPADVRKGAPR